MRSAFAKQFAVLGIFIHLAVDPVVRFVVC
jgi:hypothetical protein